MNSTGKELAKADHTEFHPYGLEAHQTELYESTGDRWRSTSAEAYSSQFDAFMRHHPTVKPERFQAGEVYEAFRCMPTQRYRPARNRLSNRRYAFTRDSAPWPRRREDPDLRRAFHDLKEPKVDMAHFRWPGARYREGRCRKRLPELARILSPTSRRAIVQSLQTRTQQDIATFAASKEPADRLSRA